MNTNLTAKFESVIKELQGYANEGTDIQQCWLADLKQFTDYYNAFKAEDYNKCYTISEDMDTMVRDYIPDEAYSFIQNWKRIAK